MRKTFGLISGVFSPLFFATAAFAKSHNIPITPPTGAITDLCIQKIPQFIIQLLFIGGVIIAVAFLIFGGIRWILSGGDKSAVENARNTIVSAIIGLIIVVAAFVIIGIVFQLLGQPNPIFELDLKDITGASLKKC